VKRWVTLHGFSVNISPDLSHFGGIIPCGISEYGVTSLTALGVDTEMPEFDGALKAAFPAFLDELRSRDKVP
jgi:lipoyl(octanoyl) transferase